MRDHNEPRRLARRERIRAALEPHLVDGKFEWGVLRRVRLELGETLTLVNEVSLVMRGRNPSAMHHRDRICGCREPVTVHVNCGRMSLTYCVRCSPRWLTLGQAELEEEMRAVSKKRAAELRKRRRIIERMKADGPVLCAKCGARADDIHELRSRARGGSITDPENCVPVCRPCHSWITEHPIEATAEGWMR